jgi:hypothetical protein
LFLCQIIITTLGFFIIENKENSSINVYRLF